MREFSHLGADQMRDTGRRRGANASRRSATEYDAIGYGAGDFRIIFVPLRPDRGQKQACFLRCLMRDLNGIDFIMHGTPILWAFLIL